MPQRATSIGALARGGRLIGGWPRLEKALGFRRILPTVGAPSFAHFAKGGWQTACTSGIFLSRRARRKRYLSPSLIHAYRANLVEKIKAKATPAPVLRLRHQSSRHRIPVPITQLLHPLLVRPNVEIIKTALPEGRAFRSLPKQLNLPRIAALGLWQQGASRTLLQDLHDGGWSSNLRFADE